jgi:lysophospholipase L1-like esterase
VILVRAGTAAIALGLVLLALLDRQLMHGAGVLGWVQWVLLAAALCIGALGFTPLSWNQNALIVLLAVGISLGVAELVLRATLRPWFDTIYESDARVLYRHVPGAERAYNYGGTVIRYKINSQGFRGKELAPLGEYPRVVVYGDSFIQGDFSKSEDTFSEQLRHRLDSLEGRSVEVVNAGVAGYGPDQELRRMQDELPVLKPNLVIVALYAGNDYGDLLRDKLYKLASDGSLQDNPLAALDDVLGRNMRRARSEPTLIKILRAARNRLFRARGGEVKTGREARQARVEADLRQANDEYRQYVIEGDNAVHDLLIDPYNADVSLTPTSASARYQVAVMEQIMRRMNEAAVENNVPLVFLLIPSPIDATDRHESGEVDPVKYPEYKRSTLTDILEQICERNGFRELNLFAPFWQRRTEGLYLGGMDDHWNARGEAYAAELMAEFLRTQGLVDSHPRGDRKPSGRIDDRAALRH